MSSPGMCGLGGRWAAVGTGGRPAGVADLPSPAAPGRTSTAPVDGRTGGSLAISPPAIALPRRGGAIAGICEGFTADT